MNGITLDMLLSYFSNVFLVPFVSAFIGFQIKNLNDTINRTRLYKRIIKAISSSLVIAVIVSAIMQFINLNIALVVCISTLAGTWGAEILDIITKTKFLRLFTIGLLKNAGGALGAVGQTLAKEVVTAIDKTSKESDKLIEEKKKLDNKENDVIKKE